MFIFLAILPVLITAQAMVGWSPPVMQCFGLNGNVLTNVLRLSMAQSHLHQPKKNNCKTRKNRRACAHKCEAIGLAIKRAAFPDHGACGRPSIELKRSCKVCTFCAVRQKGFYLLKNPLMRVLRKIDFFQKKMQVNGQVKIETSIKNECA